MTGKTPRLWVIDPSIRVPEHQGVSRVIGDWPGESRLFRPALSPGDGPGPGTGWDADGIVLMGSGASVHDQLPWLRDLTAWVSPLLDGTRAIPVLGICFGHQLIGHLTGARVDFLYPDRRKELGFTETTVQGGRLLPGTHRLKVVSSHNEVVREAPSGYRKVATRPAVEFDGLEHEHLPVFSFQFHPEARDEFVGRFGLDTAGVDERYERDNDRLLAAFRGQVLHSYIP
jgi:GMP synthase-like glutamine amidotransferase